MLIVTMPFVVAAVFAVAVYLVGRGRRWALIGETLILIVAFFLYFGVRMVTEGNTDTAMANAETIVEIQEALGIYVEPTLNLAAAERPWLFTVMNWIYIWGHWPLIALVAVWLYGWRPVGYRLTRNAFLISGAIGLVFFALLPTAPPRLADTEFIDTVTEYSNSYRLLQPPAVTNQYAAFPSLHFGWNLLIGIAIVRYARRPWLRIAGGLSPLLMLVATVFTANHYLLDVAMGGIVALVGLGIAAYLMCRDTRPGEAADDRAPVDEAGTGSGPASLGSPGSQVSAQ